MRVIVYVLINVVFQQVFASHEFYRRKTMIRECPVLLFRLNCCNKYTEAYNEHVQIQGGATTEVGSKNFLRKGSNRGTQENVGNILRGVPYCGPNRVFDLFTRECRRELNNEQVGNLENGFFPDFDPNFVF